MYVIFAFIFASAKTAQKNCSITSSGGSIGPMNISPHKFKFRRQSCDIFRPSTILVRTLTALLRPEKTVDQRWSSHLYQSATCMCVKEQFATFWMDVLASGTGAVCLEVRLDDSQIIKPIYTEPAIAICSYKLLAGTSPTNIIYRLKNVQEQSAPHLWLPWLENFDSKYPLLIPKVATGRFGKIFKWGFPSFVVMLNVFLFQAGPQAALCKMAGMQVSPLPPPPS